MQRDRVMESFRKGRTDILVATDVAARGIDVGEKLEINELMYTLAAKRKGIILISSE